MNVHAALRSGWEPDSLSIAGLLSRLLPRPLSPSRVGCVSSFSFFLFATFSFDYTRLDKQYQRTVTCAPRWNS